MHGLRQIADSCSTHGHVLDQAEQTHTVLGRNGSNALEVLLDVRLELRVAVISLGRLGYHQAACQILCQTSDLVREAGNVLLADVSQQQVDQVVACLGLGALRGASDTAAVQGLVQVGHLDQLVLDMGNGIKWIINGADISKIPSKDIDMSVTVGGNAVPENVIKNSNLGKDVKKTLQVSLGHDGEFGFKPVLSLEIGKEYAGQYANLYYYNPDTKKLEGQVSVLVKNDGTAQFTFEHASDYVISVTDEAAITNTKKSPNGGDDQNMALYIALMGFAAAMIGVSVYRKKRS